MASPYDPPEPGELINAVSPVDAMRASLLDIADDDVSTMQSITGGVSVFSGLPISASRGEFRNFEAIYFGDESDAYYEYDERGFSSRVKFQEDLGGTPIGYGRRIKQREAPAPITLLPTSTTNPDRPRTVAAGYDFERMVLTCVFRDGTYYNYYLDSLGNRNASLLWYSFKSAYSKGRFILRNLNQYPRGIADVGALPAYAREGLYRVIRSQQIHTKGLQRGHTKSGQTKAYYQTQAGKQMKKMLAQHRPKKGK